MGKSKIAIIIAREFAVRVKKKSFIFTTLLTPLLFAALMVVPSLIAMYSEGDEGLKVGVIDNSGIVMPYMESDSEVEFEHIMGGTMDVSRYRRFHYSLHFQERQHSLCIFPKSLQRSCL